MNCLVLYLIFGIFKTALGLGEQCVKNSDCSTANALCIDGACACDSLSYDDGDQCLQYATEYNAFCYDSAQCEWLGDNSDCRHNRCTCAENYRWFKGSCRKHADKGEACSSNDECYNGYDLLSLECPVGVCECSSDYYNRGNDCRKKSALLGDCALNLDCRTSLLECVLGKCAVVSNTAFIEEQLDDLDIEIEPNVSTLTYEEGKLSCVKDDDCRDMANSLCDISNKTCACDAATHFLYKGNCVQGISHCDDDADCSGNNTMCFKESCICQKGFFLKGKTCIAELGMTDPHASYNSDSDCPIKPGKLLNSVCYCKNYWFTDESNRNCIKTMIESSQSCLTNEWCSAMGPYSFCNSTTSTCQCSSSAEFNNATYYCQPISNETVVDCLRDTDCEINERCLDEVCECSEKFSRNEDNICMPDIGASCVIDSCSHMEHSYCIGGICTCGDGYIGKETRCLEIADHLEDPCEEQEQCQNFNHAVCGESENEYVTPDSNDTLRCVCEEGYMEVDEDCFQIRKYGDPCMTETECTSVLNRSYKCRNSQCQCNVGQSLKNGYCTSSGHVIVASYALVLVMLLKVYEMKD